MGNQAATGSAVTGVAHDAAGSTPVDVLMLTILQEEYSALVAELRQHGSCVRYGGTNLYGWVVGEVSSSTGCYRVALGTAGNAGNDFMQQAVNDGLPRFTPAVLLVVGVAGGLPKGTDPMVAGDIVIGNAVWSVDRGKIAANGLAARPLAQLAGWTLVANLQALDVQAPDWHAGLANQDGTPPRLIVGGIAASNHVLTVAEHEICEAIVQHSGNTVRAVEMESWGAAVSVAGYAAANQKNVQLGMIRGLSDIVRSAAAAGSSAPDNSAERDLWKVSAARHAARLALALLRHCWPYPPLHGAAAQAEFGSVLPANPLQKSPSPAVATLKNSLLADQQAGWRALQQLGLAALLAEIGAKWEPPLVLDAAPALLLACSDGSLPEDRLLALLCRVLKLARHRGIGAGRVFPPKVQTVLLAMVSVGVENWVQHQSSGVPLPPPDLAAGVHLHMSEPWALYLTAVAVFKCAGRAEPKPDGSPLALTHVTAPVDYGNPHAMHPVESALSAYARGHAAVSSAQHPARGAKQTRDLLDSMEDRLGVRPMLCVDVNDSGNALLQEPVRKQAFELYRAHTVVAGDDGSANPQVKAFETQLAELIKDLNACLYPEEERI